MDEELALKVATGFGGGIARRGEICGAVTGGLLALSLKFGRGSHDDKPITTALYAKTGGFMTEFEKRHGSIHCRALLGGCDLNTPEGQARYREGDLFHKTCLGCVTTAVELVSEIEEQAESTAKER